MIRLVAADIDGTLLDSKGRLTPATHLAVDALKSHGIPFILCTGRPVQSITGLYRELGLDSPIIAYNGAVILSGLDGKPLFRKSLLPSDTKTLLQWAEEKGITAIAWHEAKLYAVKMNQKVMDYAMLSDSIPLVLEGEEDLYREGASKILFYEQPEDLISHQESLREVLPPTINMHTSRPFFLEFVHADVSKGLALKMLGKLLDIPREQMMAVGDGFNDLSMIMYAGLGVAMGNAPREIQDKAAFVTRSCDDDGLAYAIQALIKREFGKF